MTDRAPPALYTIPPGTPFVDALAAGLLDRAGADPQALSAMRVLLPTQRACRALREAFLRQSSGRPLLLPRLTALGEMDEEELVLSEGEGAGDADGEGALDLPPALAGLTRQLLLARLIRQRRDDDTRPEQAARLAAELARLLDQVRTERLDFAQLADLAPQDYATHWGDTLAFLTVLTEHWPGVLAERGALYAADRRNRLLERQAEAWHRDPPAFPVIAAGTTGSIPATADLLDRVARLPQGCVVLPGLDRDTPDAAWADLPPSHPQYGLARLLARLKVDRGAVKDWPAPGIAAADGRRAALLHRALLPPAAAGEGGRVAAAQALEGVSRLVAPTPREEAGAIALAFREVLETPGRTAMLVTPDRGLARRVAAEMRRWGVEIDDSAGRPLDRTPTGVMLRLVAEAAAQELAPVPLLSLLKHPLAGLGWDVAPARRNVRALERAVLRGVRPAPGLPGLHGALKGDPQHDDLLNKLESALQRFLTLLAAETVEITELVRAHVAAAEALATTDDVAGPDRLWAGEGGEAAAAFVADLAEAAPTLGPIAGRDYPALFEALMGGRVVRPRFGTHPRLTILGLLEARLQSADLMILGGLNEGTWPPEPAASPWMSRPMMARFGLPLPERRIGLTAHDFVQAACAPRVMLTRAERVDGTPTVPSRWLVRLEALLDDAGRAAFDADPRLLHWLDRLDRPEGDPAPLPPPLPRPPVAARPRTLYVTHVETWVRDPYAFYAKHVLGLRTLDPVDQEPGPAQRGILVHDILGDFMQNTPDGTLEDLLAAGERAFAAQGDRPGLRAFWWPRFARAAKTLMDFEAAWRAEGWAPAVVEEEGSLALPDLAFTLKAKADRIDRKPDGTIAVMDYKTGQVPTKKAVETGLSPQLTLEAAIAREGQFPGLPKGTVAALLYLAMGGGKSAPVPGPLKLDPEAEADKALAGLKRMITRYDFEDTPYPSRPKVQFQFREGDYDHLARVREWGADGDGDDA